MSCNWTAINTPPTAADFVTRTTNSAKKQIEVQRANGKRTYHTLAVDDTFTLPNSTVAWRPACSDYIGPAFNLDIHRFLIVEDGVTVLANYDYASRASAQGYIDTFGGTRVLEIVYAAENSGAPGPGLKAYAVVEEDPNTGEEEILEVKTSELGAQGYVNLFGATKILRVATLEVTTEPVA